MVILLYNLGLIWFDLVLRLGLLFGAVVLGAVCCLVWVWCYALGFGAVAGIVGRLMRSLWSRFRI